MLDRLQRGAAGRFSSLDDALLLRLDMHVLQKPHGGQAASDENNSEGTKRPAEVGVLVEELSDLGAGKGGCDTGGVGKADEDHAILETGHVGDDDAHHVADANVSDPVQSVSGDVRFNVARDGLHDHANDADDKHDDEALGSAPDVDEFGER